jgi:hypothetical protein
MKLTKSFGLGALTALVAMALVGASSASATSTALCAVHEDPCSGENQVETLHGTLTSGTVFRILNSIADVLCLNVLSEVEVAELGNPLVLTSIGGSYQNCGTNSSHSNCSIIPEGGSPVSNLLKTGLNLGVLTAESGTVRVECTIFGFIKIDCVYESPGLENEVEGASGDHGMVTSENDPASLKEGSGVCPGESFTDYLLEPLEDVYLVS